MAIFNSYVKLPEGKPIHFLTALQVASLRAQLEFQTTELRQTAEQEASRISAATDGRGEKTCGLCGCMIFLYIYIFIHDSLSIFYKSCISYAFIYIIMYHRYLIIIYLLALRSSKVAVKQSPSFRPMFPQTPLPRASHGGS